MPCVRVRRAPARNVRQPRHNAARPDRMADVVAPASPAAPASPSAAPPAEAAAAPPSYPHVEALQPIGPPSSEVYAQVPALRAALEGAVAADATLWGAKLLDPEDKAGATVLGKCVPRPRHSVSGPPGGRPRVHGAHARRRGAPGSCARAT